MKWKFYLLAMMTAVATLFLVGCSSDDPEPEPVPPPPPPVDKFFDIAVTDITASTAFVTVTPDDNATRYYFDVLSKEDFADYENSPKAFMEFYLDWLQENNPTFTLDEILEQILSTGEDSYEFSKLKADTEYLVFAIKVSDDGTLPEEGETEAFTTIALPPIEKVDCTFDITVTDIGASAATVSVTPSKTDVPYYFDLITKADYEANGGNEDAIAQAVSSFLSFLMDYYGETLENTVASIVSTGPDSYAYESGLDPETEYYVFACGLTSDGRINTDVGMKAFKTEAVKPSTNVFTMDISNITATGSLVTLTTTNDDPYIIDVWPTADLEGLSDAEIVSAVEETYGSFIGFVVSTGDMELDNEGYLEPETDYTAFVFGYDSGTATTAVTKKTFRTLEGGDPADCTFEITVDPLKSNAANVVITPSDSSVGYYFDLMEKSDYTSDAAIVTMIKEFFEQLAEEHEMTLADVVDELQSRGKDSYNFGVAPETSYYVFAYAINEDATNAGSVYKYEFTTPEVVMGTASASVTVSKYYDGDALYAADPVTYKDVKGLAYIPTVVNHSADAAHWWVCLFGGNLTDETEYTDDLIINNVVDQGKGLKDRESINYMGSWGDLTFFAVAEDADGNYGPVFRLFFPVSKDGVSPIDDLIQAAAMGRASRSVYLSSVTRMIGTMDHMRIATLRPERKAASAPASTSLKDRLDARGKAASTVDAASVPVLRRTFDMRPAVRPARFSDKASLR